MTITPNTPSAVPTGGVAGLLDLTSLLGVPAAGGVGKGGTATGQQPGDPTADQGAPQGFAAALAALLAGVPGVAQVATTAVAPTPPTPAPSTPAPPAAAAPAVPAAPQAPAAAWSAAACLPASNSLLAGRQGIPTDPAAPGSDAVSGAAPAAATTAPAAVLMTQPGTPPAAPVLQPAAQNTPATGPAKPSAPTPNRQSRSAESGVSADQNDGFAVAAAPAAATAPASGTSPVAPVIAATSALTASSTVTTTSGDSTTTVVTRQVFPEVTRLATSPGGHRITIVLNPEHLGEVRVSMVVRQGAVRVTLDAGDQRVQQALSSSTPELQRLLERTGATDTRISVQGQAPGQAPGQSAGQSQGQSSGQSTGQSTTFSDQAGQSSQSGSGQPGQPGYEQRHLPDTPPETDDRASPAGTPRRTAAGRLDQTL